MGVRRTHGESQGSQTGTRGVTRESDGHKGVTRTHGGQAGTRKSGEQTGAKAAVLIVRQMDSILYDFNTQISLYDTTPLTCTTPLTKLTVLDYYGMNTALPLDSEC